MVTQDETSTSRYTSKIVGDSASTTGSDHWLKLCSRLNVWSWIFSEKIENTVPDRAQLQTLAPIKGVIVISDVDGFKDLP